MKRIIYTFIAISVVLMGCVSCGKSFFEQYPSNSITEVNHYQTENDFKQALMACYAKLKTQSGFIINELGYRSDESLLESMAVSTQDRYDLDHFAENSSNGLLADVWDAWYNGIYRCNDLLDHAEGKSFGKLSEYCAEALFIRSWYYFNLYRVFGVVPIVTSVVSPDEAKLVPRCTPEQMYQRLSEDLTVAAASLPKSRIADENGRVCDIAAYTLLGKVSLTFGQYDDAKTALEAAMNNTSFGMEASTAKVFNVTNKGNKEVIFRLCYDKSIDAGHSHYFASNTSVAADRQKPTRPSLELYSADDTRLGLLEYNKISSSVYVMTKWYDTFDATYTKIVGNDYILLRYADVLLMYAETMARKGEMGTACTYLNRTRTRAGLSTFNTTDLDAFIRELADERGREFIDEGHRWFDLVRLGLAVDYFTSLGYKIDSHNLLMPIPQNQIELYNNSQILWQNPGF